MPTKKESESAFLNRLLVQQVAANIKDPDTVLGQIIFGHYADYYESLTQSEADILQICKIP